MHVFVLVVFFLTQLLLLTDEANVVFGIAISDRQPGHFELIYRNGYDLYGVLIVEIQSK